MDFFTTHDSPVAVTIDGTGYRLPRFLLNSLKVWAAELAEEYRCKLRDALETDEQRERFDVYYQPPPIDIKALIERSISPEGTEYIVRHCMKAGAVPDDVIDKVIANASAVMLSNLADQLATAAKSSAKLKIEGEDGSPLTEPPPASAE